MNQKIVKSIFATETKGFRQRQTINWNFKSLKQ